MSSITVRATGCSSALPDNFSPTRKNVGRGPRSRRPRRRTPTFSVPSPGTADATGRCYRIRLAHPSPLSAANSAPRRPAEPAVIAFSDFARDGTRHHRSTNQPTGSDDGSLREAMTALRTFLDAVDARQARVAVVGQGYVGLPVAMRASEIGFAVVGFDVAEARIASLRRAAVVRRGRLERANSTPLSDGDTSRRPTRLSSRPSTSR